MKGRAPNCSKMGSQTEVRKKLKPNLWRERTEPCHNSKTRSTVMRTTDAANKKVNMRAISSPSRNRERNEREPATGPALGTMVVVVATLLDVVQGLQFLCDDFLRKLCVGQGFSIVLTIRQHPLNEALDGVPLGGVGELSGNEQPRKTGDRISRLARSVRNGNAEIIRHTLRGVSRRGSDARQVCLDEDARGISHPAIRHVVLDRVDQFDIAKGIGRIFDRAGNALIAFGA